MKKFLSLLLALTLVLSLVVVPARATTGDGESESPKITGLSIKDISGTINRGDSVNFQVEGTPTITGINNARIVEGQTSYSWNIGDSFELQSGQSLTTQSISTTAVKAAEAATVKCVVTVHYTVASSGSEEPNSRDAAPTQGTLSVELKKENIAVSNKFLATDIASVTFNTRTYTVTNGQIKIVKLSNEDLSKGNWSVAPKNGYKVTKAEYKGSKLEVTVEGFESPVQFDVTATDATFALEATPSTVLSTGTTALKVKDSNLSSSATYKWSYKKSGDSGKATPIEGTDSSVNWTVPAVTGDDVIYVVSCKATEKGSGTPLEKVTNVTVKKNDYTISAAVSSAYATAYNNSIVLPSVGNTATVTITFQDKDNREVTSSVTYGYDITGNTNAFSASNRNQKAMTVTMVSNGSISVTPYVIFMGKKISATPITITGNALTATLSSVQSGGYRDYAYSELVNAAQAAITTRNTTSYGYNYSEIVSSVSVRSQTVTNYGTFTAPSVVNGYYRFTSYGNVIGTAAVTGTVTTNRGTYSITFNIPVSPTKVTYEDQYPEPVAYGNTYRYYVQVPSGYSSYYVLGTPNQATEPNWTLTGTQYYGSTLYYLTDANFVGGKCTLWLVTKDSSNRYSCGQLTVYQKNYNINYNGVAGETVQFAQSDFNDFMNKVAEARGDASKTKSYLYVTFDYVTFSLPTTAQGTLYYGGTAMSTSNSSGAFNRNTKVTNLDSVTFVPNAKSTAKTITLNFTLYATRYSSSSTSRGTTVSYSGSVVVNLVREDIKYTVSQGDSVRFDESDFLSYLRSTKGYSSNYTIDYVTFDQSAVSAVNEGSLYTYYNGYNYGGSIKTTDKFYYSATASQNALSDVAFLASRYAKTGETVYIPFTIYARYGTTGTGTRQLTGTVAIKIGQTMNFIDVKTTDYFYDSVKWAVNKGVTTGTSSTTFSPYNPCKRAEIVTFLWRAAGSPEPTTTRNPFRDVNAVTHSSYYKAILWASQKGIAAGTSTTTFSPDQVCTRAQIVTFLYRYAGKPSGYYSNPFKDVSATNEASYYNAILWASGKGITTGSSPTTFSPYASCNRAEAVTFLYRYTNGL